MKLKDHKKFLNDLLEIAIEKNASDIHFSTGRKPILRIDGSLEVLSKSKEIDSDDIKDIIKIMFAQEDDNGRFAKFLKEREIDFSYNFKNFGRFRGNAYFQQGMASSSLRFISQKIKTIEELSLPPILEKFVFEISL